MKVYRRHNCESRHRTYRVLAKCMFPRAEWVTGEGQFACLAWCRVLTVTLWESQQDAVEAMSFIDTYACGGRCSKRHEVVQLERQS